MSVTGSFGYLNAIPLTGPFSVIVACKSNVQSTLQPRVFVRKEHTVNSLISSIEFYSKGQGFHCDTFRSNGIIERYDSVATTERWGYAVFDFNGMDTVRIWESQGVGFTTIYEDYLLDGDIILSLVDNSISRQDIFYCLVYNTQMDQNTNALLRAGVHPLEIFNRTNEISFFREYPLGNTDDYITSVGTVTFIGTRRTTNNQYSRAQYGAPSVICDQESGRRLVIGNNLSISARTFDIFNNNIIISHQMIFDGGINIPNEHTFNYDDTLSLNEIYDQVDTYISIYDTLDFANDYIVPTERTVSFSEVLDFEFELKSWDGAISTSLSFELTCGPSVHILLIKTIVLFANTDIDSNIDMVNWTDTCYLLEGIGTVDLPVHNSDITIQRLIIREEITRTNTLTRILGNNVTVHLECYAYKVTAALKENFGS